MKFVSLEQSEIGKDFPSALKLMLKNVFAIDETRGLWLKHTNGHGKGGAEKFFIFAYEGLDYKHHDYAEIQKHRIIFRAWSNEEALYMVNNDSKLMKKISKIFAAGA